MQFGFADEVSFSTTHLGQVLPSVMNEWPTPEEPKNAYKYLSFTLAYS